jgi:hypothetical protein
MPSDSFSAYGLAVASDFFLPGMTHPPAPGQPALSTRLTKADVLNREWTGAIEAPAWQTVFPDGSSVRCQRGVGGDHRFSYGRRASFHLSADATVLLCAPVERSSSEWKRFLLDTVLHCVSLIRGFEALHASAVCSPQGLVAIVGVTGSGKSCLAAELVRRGCEFFSDDVLALRRTDERLLAYPGPPLASLASGGPSAPRDLGQPVAFFPDEDKIWLAVRGACNRPRGIDAVYVLDRAEGLDTGLQPFEGGPARLLPHMLFLGGNADRAATRTEVLAELVASAQVWRLRADMDASPGDLADLIESSLPAAGVAVQEVA